MAEQAVFLAVPHNGTVSGEALPGLCWASRRGRLILAPGKVSLLTVNFNQLWCEALNQREAEGLTHFAMHHADIQAPPYWVDVLIDEMERVGADVLSVVVPLKDDRGLTTTAVGSGQNSIRRLTLTEVHELPETFSIAGIPGTEPERRLLVNTGLWVCRFTDDWIRPPVFPGFRLQDQIRWNPGTGRYEALCLSEDWGFSEWLYRQGLRVFATRKIPVTHYGVTGYSSACPAGHWITDLGDQRKDERGPGLLREQQVSTGQQAGKRATVARTETERLQDRIAAVQAEQKGYEQNWQRCEGALNVLRAMLGDAMRAEDADRDGIILARTNGVLPAAPGE